MEVLVRGLGVSAKSSGTVKDEIREASGGVPICMHVRETGGETTEERSWSAVMITVWPLDSCKPRCLEEQRVY